jgi:hypothetical protein
MVKNSNSSRTILTEPFIEKMCCAMISDSEDHSKQLMYNVLWHPVQIGVGNISHSELPVSRVVSSWHTSTHLCDGDNL